MRKIWDLGIMFRWLRISEHFSFLTQPHHWAIAVMLMVQTLGAGPVAAHPHAWIDLRSTVMLNEKGHVIGLQQEWLFDDFYTAVATEATGSASEKGTDWTALAKENLESLQAFDYFTQALADGKKVALSKVTEYSSEVRGGRLWMRFLVPFAKPIDPAAQTFSYSVFDPTYYIEILHMKGDVVAFQGAGGNRCSGHIVKPKPSTELVLLAQALDKNAKSDDTLGQMFAEKVNVSCR